MDFRTFLPLAPLALRPLLAALCDWIDRTDERLAQIEASLDRLEGGACDPTPTTGA